MNSIICFDQYIEPEHQFNIKIIAQNLDDFNQRMGTNIILDYICEDYTFYPLEENDQLAIWFCEGINELLFLAHNPTEYSEFECDQYLSNRAKEIEILFDENHKMLYKKRYIDYSPIGFLDFDSEEYIKYEINQLLKRIS